MAGGETNPLGARALSWQGGVLHPRHQSTLDHRHLRLLGMHPADERGRNRPLSPHPGRHVRGSAAGPAAATAATTSLAPPAAMPSQAAPPAPPPSVMAR